MHYHTASAPDRPMQRGHCCYVPGCTEEPRRIRRTACGAYVAYCQLHAELAERLFGYTPEGEVRGAPAAAA